MSQVEKMMKLLGISREEAEQIVVDDAEIDKMTKTKDINSDLTEEQAENIKKSKKADKKTPNNFNLDTSKRKKVENLKRQEIIEVLRSAIADNRAENFEIVNAEREFTFTIDDEKYKVVLSMPKK